MWPQMVDLIFLGHIQLFILQSQLARRRQNRLMREYICIDITYTCREHLKRKTKFGISATYKGVLEQAINKLKHAQIKERGTDGSCSQLFFIANNDSMMSVGVGLISDAMRNRSVHRCYFLRPELLITVDFLSQHLSKKLVFTFKIYLKMKYVTSKTNDVQANVV